MKLKVLPSLGLILLTAMSLLPTADSSAAVLVLYPFTGSSAASTDTELFSTASSITAGSGVTMNFITAWGNPAPAAAMNNASGVTQADAISGNDYWQFTLSADSGYNTDLLSLTMDSRKNDASGSARFFVRSSLDGYASDLYLSPLLSNTTTLASTVDLSGASFQDLSAITFRIYGYGSVGGSLRFDNITLNGVTSAVPEPSTAVLLLASAGLMLMRRRHTRRM